LFKKASETYVDKVKDPIVLLFAIT